MAYDNALASLKKQKRLKKTIKKMKHKASKSKGLRAAAEAPPGYSYGK